MPSLETLLSCNIKVNGVASVKITPAKIAVKLIVEVKSILTDGLHRLRVLIATLVIVIGVVIVVGMMVVVVVCPQLKPVQQLFKQLHLLQKMFEELQLQELQQLQEFIEEVEQQCEQLEVLGVQLQQLQLLQELKQQLQQLLVGSLHQEVVFEYL